MRKVLSPFMLLLCMMMCFQLTAQRRVSHSLYEYSTDGDGNRHGVYKMFFDEQHRNVCYVGSYSHGIPIGIHKSYASPGVIGFETTYQNGKELERKYYGEIKKFGNVVRGIYRREVFNNKGELIGIWNWYSDKSKLIQTHGELANAKGTWSQVYPSDVESRIPVYTEKYVGNDTTYIWYGYSTDKVQLYRKTAKNYIREYDQDGNIVKQEGIDYGCTSMMNAGKTNYKMDVNEDRTREEWDENGVHYVKEHYPQFREYEYEKLDKYDKKGVYGAVNIYYSLTAEDGESIKVESYPGKYKLYHNGEHILTYYIAGIGSRTILSYNNMVGHFGNAAAYQPFVEMALEIFPRDIFRRFDIKFNGQIWAMFDNKGNWVISPGYSDVVVSNESDDLKEAVSQIGLETIKKNNHYGYIKIGTNKNKFSIQSGFCIID